MTVIYHGTPMTPRASLQHIGPGRAMCVSFWRPDDTEVVEAISPAIMFRQRRVLGMDGGAEARRGLVRPARLDPILRMVGAAPFSAGSLGSDSGCARCAIADQRWSAERLAVRNIAGSPALAHGCADRAAATALRSVRAGVPGMDGHRPRQDRWLRGMVSPHGRGCFGAGEPLARDSHDARRPGRAGVSLRQRGRQQRRTERVAI